MIVDLIWKDIQKKYINYNRIRENEKTPIEQFMTESILIDTIIIDSKRMKFIFEFKNKEYQVIFVGEKSCEIKGDLFNDFGIKICKEIIPYLREYKNRYIKSIVI